MVRIRSRVGLGPLFRVRLATMSVSYRRAGVPIRIVLLNIKMSHTKRLIILIAGHDNFLTVELRVRDLVFGYK